MQVLTPTGYRDVEDCHPGDQVSAFDIATGAPIVNEIVTIERVERQTWVPYTGPRISNWWRRRQSLKRWEQNQRDNNKWVLINGLFLLWCNQSVWADGNVTHAKRLEVGQTIYSDVDADVVVTSIDADAPGPDSWVRFTITNDHSYIVDGLTLHNASRFWVLGTGNWDASTTTNWSGTSGGVGGASVPTSVDDVSFDILSNTTAYTTTVTATANCANMTWALPAVSGVPTLAGSSQVNLFGSLTNIATMLWTYTGTVVPQATATGKTITNAGVIYNCGFTFSGVGGGWTLQDDLSTGSGRTIVVTNGTLNTNAKTVTVGLFSSTSGTRTLTLDNSTINITGGSGTPWNVSSAGLTFSATGSTINVTGGAAGGLNLNMGNVALTYGALNITGGGVWNLNNSFTVKNFSYVSTTSKTDQLIVGTGPTIAASGSVTITGNSTINRAWVTSSTLGTQKTFTVPNTATVTLTNVDFQDMASAGTFGTWTGTSLGDALGNSGITFDGSTTQTYAGGTNNWSTLAAWTSRVPLPQDDVVVNTTTAGTLTGDMPRLGRNIDFTIFTRTVAFGGTVANTFFGNLIFGSTGTITATGNAFVAAGRGLQTITTTGRSTGLAFQVSAFGGTYTLQDALVTTNSIVLNNGTWDFNGFNVDCATFSSNNSNVRSLKLGSGTLSIGSIASTNLWDTVTSTNMTLVQSTSTIKLTGASTVSQSFRGGGLTFNNLWWSNTAATGTLIITGANTFNDFKINRTTTRTVTFPSATTTNIASWTDESLGTAVLTITSSSSGSAATLSKPGGDVRTDYCSIKDSAATGGASWRAGPHSTSVSGNSGWIFGNVDYPVSQTLTVGTAESGSAAKNAKPSASLVCATIQAGNIRHNEGATAALMVGESIAGSKTGAITAAATMTAGARPAGTLVRSQSGSATLAAAGAVSGSPRENRSASASLVASAALSGAVTAHDRVAASPLTAGAAIAGSLGPGTITASAALGAGAGLGGTQVSSYSKEGELDVGAEIAGRGIFQAESMTVEVLPSGATVEVLPSSATVVQRQRARS